MEMKSVSHQKVSSPNLNLNRYPKRYPNLNPSRESGKSNDGCRKFYRSRKMVYGRQFRCQPGNWILLHQAAAEGCRTSLLNWWWKGANWDI